MGIDFSGEMIFQLTTALYVLGISSPNNYYDAYATFGGVMPSMKIKCWSIETRIRHQCPNYYVLKWPEGG